MSRWEIKGPKDKSESQEESKESSAHGRQGQEPREEIETAACPLDAACGRLALASAAAAGLGLEGVGRLSKAGCEWTKGWQAQTRVLRHRGGKVSRHRGGKVSRPQEDKRHEESMNIGLTSWNCWHVSNTSHFTFWKDPQLESWTTDVSQQLIVFSPVSMSDPETGQEQANSQTDISTEGDGTEVARTERQKSEHKT